jgi:hypothetical protein
MEFSYDAADQLTSAVWKGSSTINALALAYYALGRLTNETQTVGAASSLSVGYEYFADGRRKKLIYPDGSFVISGGATNVISSYGYGYDDAGYRKWVKRSSGCGDVYKYDASDQLTNVFYDATNPDTTPSERRQWGRI